MIGVAVARAARFLRGVRCHRKRPRGPDCWQATQRYSPARAGHCPDSRQILNALDSSALSRAPATSFLACGGGDLRQPLKPRIALPFRESENDDH